MPTKNDQVLNADQAAQAIGISRRSFEDWLRKDTPPPSFPVGKRHMYWKSELLKWNRKVRGGTRYAKNHAPA